MMIGLAVVLWVSFAPDVQAWGDTGHRIICEIAFQELTPQARAEVERLIELDPDFSRFSESCIWPDHPRKRGSEHFVNLSRDASQIDQESCPLAQTCVVMAIDVDRAILGDTNASDAKKVEALKFLGHWVGDIHQPLHVSFEDDHGGNDIEEAGPCSDNLHAVWDSCIIEEKLGSEIEKLAAALRGSVMDADRTQWTSTAPKAWANESFIITTSEPVAYCVQKENACWYEDTNKTLDNDEGRKVVMVDDVYMNQHLAMIKRRLTQAGIRLGRFINQALDGQ